MPNDPNHPQTLPVANAIVSVLQNLQYPNTTNFVYVQPSAQFSNGGVQLGQWKDVVDLTANGGVCGEVYIHHSMRKRYASGGRMKDYASFYALSLCSLDNANAAEQLIINVADAMIYYFEQHTQLQATANAWLTTLQPGEDYPKIPRDKIQYRAHICDIQVESEWVVQGGFVI